MISKGVLIPAICASISFVLFWMFFGVLVVYDQKEMVILLGLTGSLSVVSTLWMLVKALSGD